MGSVFPLYTASMIFDHPRLVSMGAPPPTDQFSGEIMNPYNQWSG